MNRFGKALIFISGLMTMAHAAPGLTVNGTAFSYNGDTLFFSGINLAWINYNSDIAADALDENAWRKAVQDVRASGGNAIRWWLFNNMSTSPTINTTTHLVSGLPTNTITNLVKALDIAEEYGVMVDLCLFSHNLMEFSQWGLYNNTLDSTANLNLFEDAGTTAFISNALVPVLQAVGNHNALMTWEIFNEPEGMTSVGWTTRKIELTKIQKFTNKIASAIHNFNDTSSTITGKLLVSMGCVRADYLPYWSDANLISAGGESNGTMDFMQLHFYPYYQADNGSPFKMTYAQMQSAYPFGNKPLVVGEFPAAGWNSANATKGTYQASNVTTEECYRFPFENGYAGAMAWDYGGFTDEFAPAVTHDFAAAAVGMEALWATDSGSIKIKDYTPANTSGNGIMQVTYASVASSTGATLERTRNMVWTGKQNLTVNVRVLSGGAFSFRPVLKTGSGWDWRQSETFCDVPQDASAWTTCTFPLSEFAAWDDATQLADLTAVKSVLFQTYTDGFSGVVQFDNVTVDGVLVDDFNTEFDVWSVAAGMEGGDAITEVKTVYVSGDSPMDILTPQLTTSLAVRYSNGALEVQIPRSTMGSILLVDNSGRVVSSLQQGGISAGMHHFTLTSVQSGLYHVVIRGNGTQVSASVVIR